MADNKGRGRGNFERPQQHAESGRKGGEAVVEKYGAGHMASIGQIGGKNSSGQFKPGDPRTKEAGRKGGESSRSGGKR